MNFILTREQLCHKAGLHFLGFGITPKDHVQAFTLSHFLAFLLLAFIVEVAMVICLKSLFCQSQIMISNIVGCS